MKSLSILFTTFSFLLLCSCGTSRIFWASFDSDAVGSRPNTSPPGDPVGDLIYLSNTSGTDPLLVSNVPSFSGRSARYNNIDIPTYRRFVGFMSTETRSANKYYVRWVGRLENFTNASSPLDVWFGDSHFGSALGLRFDDGNVSLRTGTSASPTYETLGAYQPDVNHLVSIMVDVQNGTYTLSVMQRGNVLNSGTRPVLDAAPLRSSRPTLYMLFSAETSSAASYAIDEVQIDKKEPK